MRRLLIGIAILIGLLVTAAVAVPYLLPKEAIKQKVIAQLDQAVGWRLRLDGPVSLTLFPQFSLVAETIGLSGEAGADGVEFAKAKKIAVALDWGGLFGGQIKVTGLHLVDPEILLEIGPSGLTSWAPRRELSPAEEAAEILSLDNSAIVSDDSQKSAPADSSKTASSEEAQSNDQSLAAQLSRFGIDKLEIENGHLVYSDRRSGTHADIGQVSLTVNAPDLSEPVTYEGSLVWNNQTIALSGEAANLLGLLSGDGTPVTMTAGIGENTLEVSGTIGLEPLGAELTVNGNGASFANLMASVGQQLPADPGAYSIFAEISGNETSVAINRLTASLGSLSLEGNVTGQLEGDLTKVAGRLILREGVLEDLLRIAAVDYPASGKLNGDVTFSAAGKDTETLLASLDMKGSAGLLGGQVSGLGLSASMGDPSADKLENIDLKVSLAGRKEAANLSGHATWRGQAFTLNGSAKPEQILTQGAGPVQVSVKSNKLMASANGQISKSSAFDGTVSLETANLRDLLEWVGQPVEAGKGLGKFKVSGKLGLGSDVLSFENTSFEIDDTAGSGSGRVQFGGKPKVTASVALSKLVLDPYFTSSGAKSGSSNGGQSAAGNSSKTSSSSGWSDDKLDFSALKAFDMDVKAKTQNIRFEDIKIDQANLTAKVSNGVLNASLDDLKLYKGTGKATFKVTSAETPSVSASFALSGFSSYPALKDAADFKWLEGTTALNLSVSAQGASQRALVSSLKGTADYTFTDGAIRGINVPQMVRGLTLETLLGWQETSEAKTDFSSLTASFTIDKGIATNKDLKLIGPLVRMTGKGTTDMPKRTLDWRIEPKIVATLEGQAPTPRKKGTEEKLAGLGVPIVVKGSWDNPQIYPDISGILENPEAAYKKLREVGGGLFSSLKDGKKVDKKALAEAANKQIEKATNGKVQIDVQKVIEGKVDDEEVLKAVEDGLGLPSGLLGSFGKKKKK